MSLLGFFLILISFQVLADECGADINLTAPGQCLGNFPPLDQGQTPHCWAFTTATLVDAHLRCPGNSSESFRTSPWPIAMKENEDRVFKKIKSKELTQCTDYKMGCYREGKDYYTLSADSDYNINNGGTIAAGDEILRNHLGARVCDHNKLGLTDATGSDKFFEMLRTVLNTKQSTYTLYWFNYYRKKCLRDHEEFDGYWDITKSAHEALGWTPGESENCVKMKSFESKISEIKTKILAECKKAASKETWQWSVDYMDDIRNWEVENANEFISKWIDKRCDATGAYKSVSLPKLKQVAKTKVDIKNAIERQLDQSKPAGVQICSRILSVPDDNWSGIHQRGENYTCAFKRCDCSPHAMVVVGRKKVKGICTYILRNSWGTGCSGYAQIYKDVGLCDAKNGNIYLPATFLLNNAINTEFYE